MLLFHHITKCSLLRGMEGGRDERMYCIKSIWWMNCFLYSAGSVTHRGLWSLVLIQNKKKNKKPFSSSLVLWGPSKWARREEKLLKCSHSKPHISCRKWRTAALRIKWTWPLSGSVRSGRGVNNAWWGHSVILIILFDALLMQTLVSREATHCHDSHQMLSVTTLWFNCSTAPIHSG